MYKTIWEGVSNNLALKHIRNTKKGDLMFIYHTGQERTLIGIAEVPSDPYPDPTQKDPSFAVVDVKAKQEFSRTVYLKEIKSDATFSDVLLVVIDRLSVMPVTPSQWKRLLALVA